MCGIGGYSLRDGPSPQAPSRIARLLLAALAERGAHAGGWAATNGDTISMFKRSGAVSEVLDSVDVPSDARAMMVHVRDYTKGTPGIEHNNHPVEHGDVLVVHNGRISNDEQVFAHRRRQHPQMSVDSEAIAAIASECLGREIEIPHQLVGSYACAWLDRRRPDTMWVMRGNGRPLHLVEREDGVWFASTREAVQWLAAQLGWQDIEIERVEDGTLLELSAGQILSRTHFAVNAYTEEPFSGYHWDDPLIQALRDQVAGARH